MTNRFANAILLACVAASTHTPCRAASATYRAVYYLTGQTKNAVGISEGFPGVFYTQSQAMTVFSVTTQGTATVLATFPDPPNVLESFATPAANGLVYSSTADGYNSTGTVFSLGLRPGSERTYLAQSLAPTLAGTLPDGKMFGLAYGFTVGPWFLSTTDLTGNVASFYQFPSPTEEPATPIYAADGNYYGISYDHAVSGTTSYFYRVTPSGVFTKVGPLPFAGAGVGNFGSGLLLQATDGNFYGIQSTLGGCSSGNQHGAVFKLTPSGQYSILHDFGPCGPGIVNWLIQASDGKLYGVRQYYNLIFSLTTSGAYQDVFKTTNPTTQGLCTCTLVQGSDGIIYGTAAGGGPQKAGVIFALDAGLPIPKPRAQHFYPTSGQVGTEVRIWGANLFDASVTFNGTPATGVHNGGPTYVFATVPSGATTGPITVTTRGGAVTTKTSFTVQ